MTSKRFWGQVQLGVLILACGFGVGLSAPAEAAEASGRSARRADGTVGVRVVQLRGIYQDNPSGADIGLLSLLGGDLEGARSFYALCEKLEEFAKDSSIDHVLFDLSAIDLHLNLAQMSELERHIQKLREAGKGTFAWLETAMGTHYAVAAACDTILMADLGFLDLPSLSLSALHFRDAMDLLGVRASIARTGDFKGAVEPFSLSEMSEELRKHYHEMLVSMNTALVEQIARGRKVEPEKVREWQGERLFGAKAAKEAGLVDELVPYGQSRKAVESRLGREVRWVLPPKKQVKQVSFFELMSKLLSGAQPKKPDSPAIGVMHLEGMIVDGEKERPGMLVAGPAVKAISELEKDPAVRGVVVRINSPGGSVTASEAIRRALESLAAKKPVMISMGELAASGGYWVTCIGRPIFAEPGTITGSIGAFAMKLSFGPLMKRLGLNVEHVALDSSASAMSLERAWSPREQGKIEGLLQEVYEGFLQRVRDSRKIEADRLESIAAGRVWSGVQARELGLVDQLGGLDHAIEAAAKEAGLGADFKVVHRPERKSFFEMLSLFEEPSEEIRALWNPLAPSLLRRAGFDSSLMIQLLEQGYRGAPQVWLLMPLELKVR